MLPVTEFPIIDRNSSYHGVPVSELMENAGRAVAEAVRERHAKPSKVLVLCGPGNNGGDGFVVARELRVDHAVRVAFLDKGRGPRNRLCHRNMEMVQELMVDWHEGLLQDYDLVVDAMLGTGLQGQLRSPYLEAVVSLRSCLGDIVAVDVPSGWGTLDSYLPTLTVTFHDLKEGMTEKDCGSIIVADIGIPPEALDFTGPGEYLLYPMAARASHKGQNGKLLIVGGGPYTGAPALAGMGACKVGVDLLHIATPESSFLPVACHSPLFITHRLEGSMLSVPQLRRIRPLLDQIDCVLVGPGLGREPETLRAVDRLLRDCSIPMVVDADALRAFHVDKGPYNNRNMVLTPHKREFERIEGNKLPEDLTGRKGRVLSLASRLGCTILLKGEVDVISDGVRVKLNETGNAAMTSGGTGDVLAGVVAGLLSKGLSPFDAARLGAHLNGSAGDLAFQMKSYGMTAVDLYEMLPLALKEALRGIDR